MAVKDIQTQIKMFETHVHKLCPDGPAAAVIRSMWSRWRSSADACMSAAERRRAEAIELVYSKRHKEIVSTAEELNKTDGKAEKLEKKLVAMTCTFAKKIAHVI